MVFAPLLAKIPWKLELTAAQYLSAATARDLELSSRGGVWEFVRQLTMLRPFAGWGFGAMADKQEIDFDDV